MHEPADIVEEIAKLAAAGEAFAMATLVEVSGSTYRGAGARMLITASGKTAGSVSAGCLEQDIRERASQVIASGRPQVVKYDTASAEDLLWGSGTGCGGQSHVLIDCHPSIPVCFGALGARLQQGLAASLATVYRCDGDGEAFLGQRLLLDTDGALLAASPCRRLNKAITEAARELEHAGKNLNKICELETGRIHVLLELLSPPQSLIIFGSGPDVRPLLQQAGLLGWRITVVVHRPAFAGAERFPGADTVCCWEESQKPAELSLPPQAACVLMTHNYLRDKQLLAELVRSPVRYIGVLGPRKRCAQLIEELREEGVEIDQPVLARIYGPAGLDVGAESAEEIAASIIAEILAVCRKRDGGFLRRRSGAIHDR